ncbi:MAG: hypothetical protein RLZ35_1054 [Pseudomonadota bacterium]|jgi:heme exporter protein B
MFKLSYWHFALQLFYLELKRVVHRRVDWIVGWLFFLLVVSIFGISMGGQVRQLSAVNAVSIIWVGVILSILLSLDKVFYSDFKQGILDQYLSSPIPLSLLVLLKITVHWLATALPLLFLIPLLALCLGLPFYLLPMLLLTVTIGTQILSATGCLGTLLIVGLPRAGMLLGVLLLPLYVPTLLLAISTLIGCIQGNTVMGSMTWLCVLWIFTQLFSPLLGANILKVCLKNA